jgi:hypothetical protein
MEISEKADAGGEQGDRFEKLIRPNQDETEGARLDPGLLQF